MIEFKRELHNTPVDYYSNGQGVYYKENDSETIRLIKSSKEDEIFSFPGLKLINGINSNCVIFSDGFISILTRDFHEHFKIKYPNHSWWYKDYSGKKILLSVKAKDKNLLYLYDNNVDPEVIKIEREETYARFTGNNSILLWKAESNQLTCISLFSKQVIWSNNLDYYGYKEGVKIRRVILNSSYVFLYASDFKLTDYAFKVIDVHTGECVLSTKEAFTSCFHMHKRKIYAIGNKSSFIYLLEIGSLRIKKIDLTEELGDYLFETQCEPYFYEDEMFVALKIRGEDIYGYWGIIDLTTYKFKCIYPMLKEYGSEPMEENITFVSQIIANDKIIVIRVGGCTLRVFERS